MIDYAPKYLVMVTAGANNNKYYRMTPQGDMWLAEYGRIGGGTQSRTYSKYLWEKKYNEKIKKGYVDQTDLVQDLISIEKPKVKSPYKAIDNLVIADIVERLQNMARKAISENYIVSSNKVTQAMVDEAQSIINGLLAITDLKQFNDELVIPRQPQRKLVVNHSERISAAPDKCCYNR